MQRATLYLRDAEARNWARRWLERWPGQARVIARSEYEWEVEAAPAALAELPEEMRPWSPPSTP